MFPTHIFTSLKFAKITCKNFDSKKILTLCFFAGHVSVNGWRSSFLGLAAVNLAESAGDLISIDVLAEMYVSAAIQIRTSFPEGLQFIAVSWDYYPQSCTCQSYNNMIIILYTLKKNEFTGLVKKKLEFHELALF